MQHRKHSNAKNTKGGVTRQQQKVQTKQRQEFKCASDVAGCPSMIESNAYLAILLAIHAIRKDILAFVYRSKHIHEVLEEATNYTAFYYHADVVFLGTVNTTCSTKLWTVDVKVNKTATICFKLDTGADVSVISSNDHTRQAANCRSQIKHCMARTTPALIS